MKVAIACLVALVATVAIGITLLIHYDAQFDHECHSKGGHVVQLSRDAICVSDDGRIIGDY